LLCGFNISIIKRLGSLNTTIYFDIIKKEKQLHVSAPGHRQVGSFGFALCREHEGILQGVSWTLSLPSRNLGVVYDLLTCNKSV
jgi:hypothetical protein